MTASTCSTFGAQIAGMRDRLIHHYFGVDLELVWNVVERDVPKLGTTVDELLA